MPLYSRIEVKDLSGNTYIVGGENRGYTLNLHKDEAGELTLTISDPKGIFKERYVVGGEVTLYCDGNNPPQTKVFTGIIESVVEHSILGTTHLEITATEKFWVKCLGRLVVDSFSGKRAGEVVRILMQKYAPEYDVSHVQDTDVVIKAKRFNYRPLKECLDELAEIAGAQYHCTPDGELHFYPKESLEQAITVDESMVCSTPRLLKDLKSVKTVVYVHGGYSLKLIAQQEATGGSVSLHDRDIAVKFTPNRIKSRFIQLHLEKVGSPKSGVSGSIVEDSNNKPSSIEVGVFTIPPEEFTEAGWRGVWLEADLDPSKSYWLTLHKVGDPQNTYRWHHNNSTTDTHAEREEDEWATYEYTWAPCYRIYGGDPVVAKAVDPTGVERYGHREEIVSRPDVTSVEDARRIALQLLAEKRCVRMELPELRLHGLNVIPEPGRLIQLKLESLGYEGKVVVEDVKIEFRAGCECVDEVVVKVGEDPEQLAQTLQEIERRLEEEKRRGLDATSLLNLAETFYEPLTIAASLYTDRFKHRFSESLALGQSRFKSYQQASASFTVGVARAGFCDLAGGG